MNLSSFQFNWLQNKVVNVNACNVMLKKCISKGDTCFFLLYAVYMSLNVKYRNTLWIWFYCEIVRIVFHFLLQCALLNSLETCRVFFLNDDFIYSFFKLLLLWLCEYIRCYPGK